MGIAALLQDVLLFVFVMHIGAVGGVEQNKTNRVWILSFDGFPWDYFHNASTPNLDSMAAEGVHAPEGITPTFITKTYPSHYTMVTGLHTECHGIINNKMYDEQFNATFTFGNNESRWWDGGQPIWTLATLQGLKCGISYWPGSDVELESVRPLRWKSFNNQIPFKDRIDEVIKWMVDDQIDFAASYFHEPDYTGHQSGALSTEVKYKVKEMDDLFGYAIERLKSEGLYETTDVILLSDHGMTNVTITDEFVIVLSDFLILEDNIELIPDEGPVANILPKKGKEEYVYQKLSKAHPNLTVYWKNDIPDRLHYKIHRRILPIVIIADEGYYVKQKRPYDTDGRTVFGVHGYDNTLSSMRPIFFARGPHFKTGYKIPSSYQSVNVYSLLCHLLGLTPAPNNGSLYASTGMLTGNSTPKHQYSSICLVVYSALLSYALH